jgi:hypothetical protein
MYAVDRGLGFIGLATRAIAHAIDALCGIGLALAFVAFVVLGTSRGADVSTGVPVLLGLGAVVLPAAGVFYRTDRHRRDRSKREAVDPLVVVRVMVCSRTTRDDGASLSGESVHDRFACLMGLCEGWR